MRRIVNGVIYCAKTESGFRGHDEGDESDNKGCFKEWLG